MRAGKRLIYSETVCSLEKCNENKIKGGKYCLEHTCETDGCLNQKSIASHYCYTCIENRRDNKVEEITLTDSQVQKAKETVKEYENAEKHF